MRYRLNAHRNVKTFGIRKRKAGLGVLKLMASRTPFLPRLLFPSKIFPIFLLFLFFAFVISVAGQAAVETKPQDVVVISDVRDAEIFAFGKKVIIQKEAKGVLVFGGDIEIEGKVTGDVAVIGGTILLKENGFIGGDVIVFGGSYKHEKLDALRTPGTQTIIYAGYDEQLREIAQNPWTIFSPDLSLQYLGSRVFGVLFWFVTSLLINTIAPGAVSRAVTRIRISAVSVAGLGLFLLILGTAGLLAGFNYLSPGIAGAFFVAFLFLFLLAYVYGRVALQVAIGKVIQSRLFPSGYQSESVALIVGAFLVSLVLSLPYLWTVAVVLLFSISLGLVAMSPFEKSAKN